MINHDSTAKHLSYDGVLHYKFVNYCAGKRIFKIREVTGKMVDRFMRPIHLKTFVLKDAELAG